MCNSPRCACKTDAPRLQDPMGDALLTLPRVPQAAEQLLKQAGRHCVCVFYNETATSAHIVEGEPQQSITRKLLRTAAPTNPQIS
jgi:hypothetical protein